MISDIAIIGAAGFIGRHICSSLEGRGATLNRYARRSTALSDPRYLQIDLTDMAALRELADNSDIVYYLISETIPSSSWEKPLAEIENNLRPFMTFLEAASSTRVKKVVFISSAGTVYGTTNGKVADDADKRPFSPYGITKLAMENFLEYYRRRSGLQYDVYRVSNVYGSGQNTGKGLGVINTFLEKIIAGEKIVVYGDGSVMRNYIYVGDVASVMARSVDFPDRSDVFNLASDAGVSLNELISVIREVVDEDFEVQYVEGRKSDNSFIDLDNSRLLGAYPGVKFTPLKTGIEVTYRSLKTAIKTR